MADTLDWSESALEAEFGPLPAIDHERELNRLAQARWKKKRMALGLCRTCPNKVIGVRQCAACVERARVLRQRRSRA
jgi:hypothetical protein